MKKLYAILAGLFLITIGLSVVGKASIGALDPTNAPGPTMHTLEEIYDAIWAIPTACPDLLGG